ncbi:uncharacterized protein LOC111873365 [Cryptotermes secundus]|uniref:uncharacterized protein LOC111873365 n=1 Tax=Cryptotermes secundus TaxID=105785 RepID=UPI000CD7D21A|nr:uncharacterized protein LOC111873365 [Cryptotermes secundus]
MEPLVTASLFVLFCTLVYLFCREQILLLGYLLKECMASCIRLGVVDFLVILAMISCYNSLDGYMPQAERYGILVHFISGLPKGYMRCKDIIELGVSLLYLFHVDYTRILTVFWP